MGEALTMLVGPDAKGLSASAMAGLQQVWGKEYQQLVLFVIEGVKFKDGIEVESNNQVAA